MCNNQATAKTQNDSFYEIFRLGEEDKKSFNGPITIFMRFDPRLDRRSHIWRKLNYAKEAGVKRLAVEITSAEGATTVEQNGHLRLASTAELPSGTSTLPERSTNMMAFNSIYFISFVV